MSDDGSLLDAADDPYEAVLHPPGEPAGGAEAPPPLHRAGDGVGGAPETSGAAPVGPGATLAAPLTVRTTE
eukprot:9275125-Alexandrium_andersonii.AAC.1